MLIGSHCIMKSQNRSYSRAEWASCMFQSCRSSDPQVTPLAILQLSRAVARSCSVHSTWRAAPSSGLSRRETLARLRASPRHQPPGIPNSHTVSGLEHLSLSLCIHGAYWWPPYNPGVARVVFPPSQHSPHARPLLADTQFYCHTYTPVL